METANTESVTTSTSEMQDVYVCHDDHETSRVQQLLEDEGIESLVRIHGSAILPTTIGHSNDHVIAVAAVDWDRARTLIHDALEDEVISHEGEFAEPEDYVAPEA